MSRSAIEDLIHTYSDAVIHRDETRWARCWDAEATWSLPGNRRVQGRRDIVDLWRSAMASYEIVVQHAHDGSVVLDEGRGTGRWHISEHTRRVDGAVALLLAAYDDTYVRVDGRWLFASRALAVHYRGPPDLSGTFSLPAVDPALDGRLSNSRIN